MKRIVLIVTAACVVVFCGFLLRQMFFVSGPAESARSGVGEVTLAQERELLRIATLGYIAGRAQVPDDTGVLSCDASAAFTGPTLFTYAKGPAAVLIDIDGERLHSWSRTGSDHWARAHLYANGDLLVITCEPYRLMKIDRNSELLWMYEKPAHHDFDTLPDGSIWVLVREATSREGIHDGAWLLDDVLTLVDSNGRELTRVSLLEAFERTGEYAHWVADAALSDGPDVFHTNSVEVVDGGRRALVSIRAADAVAMLDLETGMIDWVLEGSWRMQHEAQLVGGNLLLFDNLGHGEQSRVLEVDLATSEIVWSYTAAGFLTKGAGAQQRLPNGNTLITESERGRVIEVTPAGRVVWEYVNPLTVPGEREVTLGIMRAERLPPEFSLEWAQGHAGISVPAPVLTEVIRC
ncbi:arylsulfotransferase family protein [bacterium]|nr:arylsulfotransferase family protein [bacterium]